MDTNRRAAVACFLFALTATCSLALAGPSPKKPPKKTTKSAGSSSASSPPPAVTVDQHGASSIPRTFQQKEGEELFFLQEVNGFKPPPAVVPPLGAISAPARDLFEDVVAVGSDGKYRCTGVLIAPRWVLTARHCAPATTVLFGGDVKDTSRTDAVRSVRTPTGTLDVALLELAHVSTVKTRPRRAAATTTAPAGLVRLIGFGSTESTGKQGFGVKRFLDVPIFGWGCDERRATGLGCRPDDEMAILRRGGADTCNGDSGGPVFERLGNDLRLVAVTSRPVPGGGAACGGGGIYVRIDRIATWIDATIASPGGPR